MTSAELPRLMGQRWMWAARALKRSDGKRRPGLRCQLQFARSCIRQLFTVVAGISPAIGWHITAIRTLQIVHRLVKQSIDDQHNPQGNSHQSPY